MASARKMYIALQVLRRRSFYATGGFLHFFLDRCIAKRLARMLDAYDVENTIRHLDDDARFYPNSPDVDIIAAVSADEPKPVYVTADQGNRRVPAERAALRDSGMTVIFLRGRFHHIAIHDQALKLLRIWPEIVNACARCREPKAFEITPGSNKVSVWKLTRDL